MISNQPRILIAGTGSGCGKTTVSSALLRAFQRRGMQLCAFKCGPDYIDPMFHRAALGIPSYNLDLFFLPENEICKLIARHLHSGRFGILEGVMGFYDGVSGNTDIASSAHLSRATQTPAILVVRPKGQSLSLAAMIQGFLNFQPNTISGIILNGVSEQMYPFYREIVERIGVKVYGFLPALPEFQIPDRHLGLVTAAEVDGLQDKLNSLAQVAEKYIDLDGLWQLANTAPNFSCDELPMPNHTYSVRIAVAMDKAFCFYYQDNLDILTEFGVEIVLFSPLKDHTLPKGIDGCYLGGGYPELHAVSLAANQSLLQDIRDKIQKGLPTIAECGGFMYLGQSIETEEGLFSMVGALPSNARLTKRLQNFGYVTLTAYQDNLLCKAGQSLRAHEFHYAQSDMQGSNFCAKKANGKTWDCVFANSTLYAGYPHLYFRAQPTIIENFLQTCLHRRERK